MGVVGVSFGMDASMVDVDERDLTLRWLAMTAVWKIESVRYYLLDVPVSQTQRTSVSHDPRPKTKEVALLVPRIDERNAEKTESVSQ